MRSLAVASLSIRDFRNLARVDLQLDPRFNVVAGDNGQGKTNLLEAVYVLATSRSFRTSRLDELVATGAETASIRGVVHEAEEEREQSVGMRRGLRATRIDGKRPPSLAAYALRTPTVVFHPGALALTAGGGSERRRLLDRIALYASPASLADAASYAKAMRARQRVLERRGDDAGDLDGWEELMVRHGLALSAARSSAAEVLIPAARRAFTRIGPTALDLRARYVRGAPAEAEAFRSELAQRRARDRARGSATSGPHRDDLELLLGGVAMRGMASQGQHRAVVLALELAEIDVVTEARGVRPVLLLDDVSSELDRERMASLLEALRQEQGQVLITTTRPELIDAAGLAGAERKTSFRVVGGTVAAIG
jgi:DNA replication and repair protein RecF